MLEVVTTDTLTEAAQAMGDRARFLNGGTLVMRVEDLDTARARDGAAPCGSAIRGSV